MWNVFVEGLKAVRVRCDRGCVEERQGGVFMVW